MLDEYNLKIAQIINWANKKSFRYNLQLSKYYYLGRLVEVAFTLSSLIEAALVNLVVFPTRLLDTLALPHLMGVRGWGRGSSEIQIFLLVHVEGLEVISVAVGTAISQLSWKM